MPKQLPLETIRVKSWLESRGFTPDIRFLDQTTDTSQAAADAINVPLGQISKSLVFYNTATKEPILILVSGANRVNKDIVGEYLKSKIKTASPEFVLAQTGFKVGGVPPVGFNHPLKTLIDRDLMQYDVIYSAAGSDHTLFPISPQTLKQLTSAEIISVC
jgi:prolyl-tRNA editing enzyme YbaK/EbsC (Cys-tRNA(Pro) deacylase)